MTSMQFELYLDERGDFEDDDKSKWMAPSLVGSVLFPSFKAKKLPLDQLVQLQTHAMEQHDKDDGKIFTV